jgi:two-component system nitrate/nitrite response regulator NarL
MRVLVVEGVGVYRHAMCVALSLEERVAAVDSAYDADTALQLLHGQADSWVVLLNMAMANSVRLLRTIVEVAPSATVVAIAHSEAEEEIIACVDAGVAGYVLRGDSFADLMALMSCVVRGETLCSPRMAAALLRRVASLANGRVPETTPPARLTAREREIMQLVDDGLSNKQIARRLSIELPTVKNHIHHILQKLQVSRREEAAARFRTVLRRLGGYQVWSGD